MAITAADVAKLRAQTGAGMLDCKKALEETNGNFEAAVDALRQRGAAKAAKRADKVAAEGVVISYIHGAGRIGVLLELNCETDFVARTDSFRALATDIAMHIAAAAPRYMTRTEVAVEELDREKNVYREQLKAEGKPAEMIEKIVEGKMAKFYGEICLMEQTFIKDEEKTIEKLLAEKTAEIGEKLSIRRYVRFELGEGIEKPVTDFAAEVGHELSK